MENTRNSRRGFFFTAMALAILSFMLLTSQVWVRTFEQQDASAVIRFKGEAMRLVLSTLSSKAMSDFANASAFYATYKLVNATETSALDQLPSSDPNNPFTGRVENATEDLMLNGASPALSITYSPEEKGAYTISAWQDKIQEAANVMGFNASFGGVQNFTFRQLDPWTVGIYFQMPMNLSDQDNIMRQSETLTANSSFSINGFVDPMEAREEAGLGHLQQKQIWKDSNYGVPSDVAPIALVDSFGVVNEGYGWFFGPLTWDYPDQGEFAGGSFNGTWPYILVSAYNESNESLASVADAYGAVIVTSSPGTQTRSYTDANGCNVTETNQTDCLNCLRRVDITNSNGHLCSANDTVQPYVYANPVSVPMIQAGTWSGNVPLVANGMPANKQFVLIDNRYPDALHKQQGYHRIWDITKLRDMTVCGFYVHAGGPSFFQRMVANAQSLQSNELGIESFLVGQWAGGALDTHNDYRSRLDWEFYQNIQGQDEIKGMPGCKNAQMCKSDSDATSEGVGLFKLTQNATERYGMDGIACVTTSQSPWPFQFPSCSP